MRGRGGGLIEKLMEARCGREMSPKCDVISCYRLLGVDGVLMVAEALLG